MKCVRCGFEIPDPSVAFCTSCGMSISSSAESVPSADLTAPTAPAAPVAPVTSVDVPAPVAPAAPAVSAASDAPAASVAPVVPVTSVDVPAPVAPAAPAFGPAPGNYSMPADPYAGGVPQPYSVDAPAAFHPGSVPPPLPAFVPPCGNCGAPIQAGCTFCTTCGAPSPAPLPARPPKKKMSKGGRAAIISVISLVVLIAGLFTTYLVLRTSRYDKAVEAMNNGEYQVAQEEFESWILSNYKDSAENAEFCRKTLLYNQATEALDREDYATAADLFGQIPGFEDADYQNEYCLAFVEAIGYYNNGQYWNAYDIFRSLYSDAAEVWMDKCIQTPPSTGVVEQGSAYATGSIRMTILLRTSKNLYFSIYTIDGGYWGSIFMEGNSTFSVSLPAGTYYFHAAYGNNWFGDNDKFGHGSDAIYNEPLVISGQSEFKLSSNYTYELTLVGR